MKKTLLSIALLAACLACGTKETIPTSVYLSADCAYESRQTVSVLTYRKGTLKVTQAGTETWTDIYLDGDAPTPYCPCNLPASFAENGKRVVFSAEVKETHPNEKWRCQPVRLTTLAPLAASEK